MFSAEGAKAKALGPDASVARETDDEVSKERMSTEYFNVFC
jgi:hypothetical protein